MGSDAKVIRRQVRQVVKEILPELLASELGQGILKDLLREVNLRLMPLSTQITETLEKLDQRSKDSLGYLVRQASNIPVSPLDTKPTGTLADGS